MSPPRSAWYNITLDEAKRVRDCALARASELDLSVSVVVVDRTGIILIMETADSAPPGSSEASIMKAKGAARYRVATHKTAEFVKTLPAPLAQYALSLPEACAFHGGVPIQIEAQVIGAIGVSGGSGAQDVEIATAAAIAIY